MSKLLNDKRDIICGSHLDCSLSSILCDHPTLFTRVRGKKEGFSEVRSSKLNRPGRGLGTSTVAGRGFVNHG
jgi:hypothetical protein